MKMQMDRFLFLCVSTTALQVWLSPQAFASNGCELYEKNDKAKGLLYRDFAINSSDHFRAKQYSSVFHCDNDCKSFVGCKAISFDESSNECKFYNQTGMKDHMVDKVLSVVIIYTPMHCPSFNAVLPGIWSSWQIVDPWRSKDDGLTCHNKEKRVCESSMPECVGVVRCEGQNEKEVVSNFGGDLIGIDDVRETGAYCFKIGTVNKIMYCEIDEKGKVWIHIQRRVDGSQKFNLNWNSYKEGFGDVNHEFWLGNKWIHHLTAGGLYKIRFEMSDGNESRYMEYNQFIVGPSDGFQLTINYASGNAGEAMFFHSNGSKFTTYDRDQDRADHGNCAVWDQGGWWYGYCHLCNPNGLYLNGINNQRYKGIVWLPWKGELFSMITMMMKITKK